MPHAIENWIQLIPGFMQTLGDSQQGIPSLWHRLYDKYKLQACVQMHPWNTNWADVAEQIFRTSQNGKPPRIVLVAYSWGVGFGAVKFLRELIYRNLHVEVAVFSDGVYHLGGTNCHRVGASQVSAYLTRPWGRPCILLPRNVSETHWYVQRRNNFRLQERRTWLRGHNICWESEGDALDGELIPGKIEVARSAHGWMDENNQFKNKVLEVCNRLFGAAA